MVAIFAALRALERLLLRIWIDTDCLLGRHDRAWTCDDVALPLCMHCGHDMPLTGREYDKPGRQ